MTRLVELFRVTSSMSAVVLLIAMNLIPLAGVLWWGWSTYSLLVLYWLENGIIGALNVLRILRAEGAALPPGATFRMSGSLAGSRAALVAFFILHYGIFWVVHGVFVFLLPVFIGLGSMAADAADGFTPGGPGGAGPFSPIAGPALRWDVIGLGGLALAISHGTSYVLNYIGRREYRHASPAGLMMAPYARVIVLHVTILLGIALSSALGSPVGALAVLVVGKTILDLALHLAEHRRATPPAGTA